MIDLISFIFILLAWFVEMPLWLSIILTVYGGIRATVLLVAGIYNAITKHKFTLFNF